MVDLISGEERNVRAIVADVAAIWREGVTGVLREAGIEVIAQATDAEQLTMLVDRDRPDVVVVDARMPAHAEDDGLRAALWIRRSVPGVGVLVLSTSARRDRPAELLLVDQAGVGYLLKDRIASSAHLIEAVNTVAAGGSVIDPAMADLLEGTDRDAGPLAELTPRELDVLRLMAEGHSNHAIAEQLVVTLKTVEGHVSMLIGKLGLSGMEGANRRVHAVLTYLRATGATPDAH